MMYLKVVSHTDGRGRMFQANDIQWRWVSADNPLYALNEEAEYCFHENPGSAVCVEFEPNIEFWLFDDGEPRQVLVDIGRDAYIMNENGKTIERIG